MKKISLAIISLSTIAMLAGCAGGVSRTTINGETTYKKDGKVITREQAAAENSMFARELENEKRQAEFEKALKTAPRRTASEPVSVALLKPIVPPNMKINKAKLVEHWWGSFKNQKMLPLVNQKKVNAALKNPVGVSRTRDWSTTAKLQRVPGDVYVQFIFTTADVLLKNSKTKKVSMQTIPVFRAEIASPYLDEKYVFDEKVINIFKNVDYLNTLSAKVRAAIQNQVRPRLPSSKWLAAQNKPGLEQLLQALKEGMNKE